MPYGTFDSGLNNVAVSPVTIIQVVLSFFQFITVLSFGVGISIGLLAVTWLGYVAVMIPNSLYSVYQLVFSGLEHIGAIAGEVAVSGMRSFNKEWLTLSNIWGTHLVSESE